MKSRDKESSVSYFLGVIGASTIIAFFKSIMDSKALAIIFFIGTAAVFSFLWSLFTVQ